MTPEARRNLSQLRVSKTSNGFIMVYKNDVVLKTTDHEVLRKEFGKRIREIKYA